MEIEKLIKIIEEAEVKAEKENLFTDRQRIKAIAQAILPFFRKKERK